MEKVVSYFSVSWALLGNSWRYLMRHKDLLWLPFINLCFQVAVIVVSFWLAIKTMVTYEYLNMHQDLAATGIYRLFQQHFLLAMIITVVVVCLLILLLNFISQFCNCILLVSAHQGLQGQRCSLAQAFVICRPHLMRIMQWAFIVIIIHAVIRRLERIPNLGAFFALSAGVAWSFVAFFVLPMVVFQHLTPMQAIKQMRQQSAYTWQRIIGVNGILVLAVMLVFLLLFFIARIVPGSSAILTQVAIAVAVVSLLFFSTFGVSLQNIVKAAIYLQTVEGRTVVGFDSEVLSNALVMRQRRRGNGKQA